MTFRSKEGAEENNPRPYKVNMGGARNSASRELHFFLSRPSCLPQRWGGSGFHLHTDNISDLRFLKMDLLFSTYLSFRACFSKCCTRRHRQLSSGVLLERIGNFPWQAPFSGRHFKGYIGDILVTFLVFCRAASWPQCPHLEPFAVCFAQPSR